MNQLRIEHRHVLSINPYGVTPMVNIEYAETFVNKITGKQVIFLDSENRFNTEVTGSKQKSFGGNAIAQTWAQYFKEINSDNIITVVTKRLYSYDSPIVTYISIPIMVNGSFIHNHILQLDLTCFSKTTKRHLDAFIRSLGVKLLNYIPQTTTEELHWLNSETHYNNYYTAS